MQRHGVEPTALVAVTTVLIRCMRNLLLLSLNQKSVPAHSVFCATSLLSVRQHILAHFGDAAGPVHVT